MHCSYQAGPSKLWRMGCLKEPARQVDKAAASHVFAGGSSRASTASAASGPCFSHQKIVLGGSDRIAVR